MAHWLHRRGVLTKLRHSAGQDVGVGCGQLRAREIAPGSHRIDVWRTKTGPVVGSAAQ